MVFIKDLARAFKIREPYASRLLVQAVLSGKVRNLGYQKGWMAVK